MGVSAYHVLGKRLREADVVALLDKVPHGKGVLVDVAAGEALVGHVEEAVVALRLHGGLDLLPLLGRGVDAGRVVRAGVEQEHAALGRGLDVGEQTLEVEADRVLVVVPVLLDLHAGVLEDGGVVGPRRVRDVDLLGSGVEALEEGGADAQGARAGYGLGDDEAVEGGAVLAVGQHGGGLGELGHTRDAGVLLVQPRGDDLLLGLADGGQDVWLALVIAVGADACLRKFVLVRSEYVLRFGRVMRTEVDLLVERVGLEGFCDTCSGR